MAWKFLSGMRSQLPANSNSDFQLKWMYQQNWRRTLAKKKKGKCFCIPSRASFCSPLCVSTFKCFEMKWSASFAWAIFTELIPFLNEPSFSHFYASAKSTFKVTEPVWECSWLEPSNIPVTCRNKLWCTHTTQEFGIIASLAASIVFTTVQASDSSDGEILQMLDARTTVAPAVIVFAITLLAYLRGDPRVSLCLKQQLHHPSWQFNVWVSLPVC